MLHKYICIVFLYPYSLIPFPSPSYSITVSLRVLVELEQFSNSLINFSYTS